MTALWKQYAREFVKPRLMPQAVRLNFNLWYVSADYRRELAGQLGWTFTDRGFGSKAGWKFSHGSSFGDTDPAKLELSSRWKRYENDEEFAAFFDDEVRQLSQQIFNFCPPLPKKAAAKNG